MKRRDFLKTLGLAVAATAVPSAVIKTVANKAILIGEIGHYESIRFIESVSLDTEYGNALMVSDYSKESVKKGVELLIADVRQHLPIGAHYELRQMIPKDYGRFHGIAWYASPAMQNKPWKQFISFEPEYIDTGGYFLLGQLVNA